MFAKQRIVLLVAALVLVPTIARAVQKFDWRPRPAASFRDVERPPELNLEPPTATAVAPEQAPVLQPSEFVDTLEQPLPRPPGSRRSQTLRAPPAAV